MEKLYFNGDIITMEEPNDVVEAVLVADGKIKAVGAYDAVAAQKSADCEMVDLQGKTLMPSFIDAHGHITMTKWHHGMLSIMTARIITLETQIMARPLDDPLST